MDSRNEFVVATFGVSKHELRVLKTVFLISRNRAQTYVLANAERSRHFDLAIVDYDDAAAMVAWQGVKARNPILPVIMIARQPPSSSSSYYIGRPLMATRLLALLDQASSERAAFSSQRGLGAEESKPAARELDPRKSDEHKGQTGLKVLVVDDSLPVRKQIERVLAPLVSEIDQAETGENAFGFISETLYDIIFLDVVLPGVDGYQICKTIKRNKGTKHTPVIMLTGKSSPFDRVKGKLAGCDSYLTKPVNPVTFEKLVRSYMK